MNAQTETDQTEESLIDIFITSFEAALPSATSPDPREARQATLHAHAAATVAVLTALTTGE